MPTREPGSELLVPAVTRAAAILNALASEDGVPLGPSELGRRLGLPKSSIANICGALADVDFVHRNGGGFTLGRRLAELGGAYLQTVDQIQEFHAASRKLPSASQETLQFGVLDGLEVTYLARHTGRQPMQLTSGIGRRLPASCTAIGKAALAALDDSELERRMDGVLELPVLTPHSHGTPSALLEDLRQVRERGYAIDDGETIEGVVGYAMHVAGRHPMDGPFAVSAGMLKVRATGERVEAVLKDLATLSAQLSDPFWRAVAGRGDLGET